ncbi:hypothetical protein AB0M32_36220 [Streptomyces sp. NPDC051985]|uniref:hypothetical protein n=1 Tax=Streptomyces sp. NPDC051985 TaxID=3155807 RepID=UPI0034274F51
MPVGEETRDAQHDPLFAGEFVGDREVLLAVALHHLQILEKQLQLREIAVHRLGRGRDLATADGARARTHLEGPPGRHTPVQTQHPQGGRRL